MGEPAEGWAAYRAHKADLIGSLRGTVLEIGAGAGANLASLPAGTRWIGLEPAPRRRIRLLITAARSGRAGRVVAGVAESLPLADHSVEAVLSTAVLCSVRDQRRVLAEIRRVLVPGGRFVFLEHVEAPPRTLGHGVQRLWAPLSRRYDGGCDPLRRTGEVIDEAGFASVRYHRYHLRPHLDPMSPRIVGVATA